MTRTTLRRAARPHRTLLAACIGAALAQLATEPARADSGVGADTALGNALSPAGVMPAGARDPDGLGEALHSRTPTGFMTVDPYVLHTPAKAASGWLTSASVEAGVIASTGGIDAAKYREYRSIPNGPLIANYRFVAEKPDSAHFVELTGGSPGRSDQFFGLVGGRYNDWKVSTFYNEIEHVFTTTYRNLWSGTGTGRLTLNNLPAGPVAPATAASTDIAIGNAALATPFSELAVTRRKGGMRVDMNLPSDLKFFALVTTEKREGARPFGLVGGGGGGTGGVEIPETIDYDTHEAIAGLQWSGTRTSVNVQASASLFRNHAPTLTVDNPMFLPAANGITGFPQAVFALAPSNELYGVKAEVAHAMPELWRARFTGTVSANSSRQNAELIPQTPYAGAVVNGVAGGAWDTVASLSRRSADARIDSTLVDLGLALTPVDALSVKAKLRRYETDNSTEYWACNPLTGQWGRLVNDGSGGAFAAPSTVAGVNPAGTTANAYNTAGCDIDAVRALNLVPAAGNINIRNIPYAHKQTNASLGADWRVAPARNVTATIEREAIARAHRERDETNEDRIKFGWVDRSLAGGTLRLSFEEARRGGSPYVADPYDAFYSASFGGIPTVAGTNMTSWIHVNDLHRKFDLADRRQSTLNLRWNHALRPDLDLAITGQARSQRYPDSAYGRSGRQRQESLTLDLNWQPTQQTSLYGWVAQQNGRMTQTNLQQNACLLGTTYYFYSDGSVSTVGTPTAAQTAAGITVVGNSGAVTAANFLSLCGSASATSPLYPTSRTWTATQDDNTSSFGVGGRHDVGKIRFDGNFTFVRGRTRIGYTYNAAALGLITSGAPTAAQQAVLDLIGTGFSDLVFRQQIFDASMVVPLNKSTALRVLLRHEIGRIRDWHYDGVAQNPTPGVNQQTYLDAGPQDYRVTAIGATLQISW